MLNGQFFLIEDSFRNFFFEHRDNVCFRRLGAIEKLGDTAEHETG